MQISPTERHFLEILSAGHHEQALAKLEATPDLMESRLPAVIEGISFLLLICNAYEDCIAFLAKQIKVVPTANLHYNLGYAHEMLGQTLEAIRHYQCSRLFSMDFELRREIQIKLLQLRNPEACGDTLDLILQHDDQQRLFILEQLKNPHLDLSPDTYITVTIPENPRKPRILYGTMEIANHIAHYLSCFRKQGLDVFAVDYYPSYLNYECDFSHSLSALSPNHTLNHYALNAVDLICEYDVFHFLFHRTLMPDGSDLIALKKLGKRVFMHNLGSEIRIPELARKHHKYWNYAENYLSQLDGPTIQQNIKSFSHWIDDCIINDHEMLSYVEPYYKNSHMIGLPIDLEKYPYVGLNKKGPIRIVHAPTNRSVKGSQYFEAAIENLKKRYELEYCRIERTTHEEAIKHYAAADIVLDELIIGTYGSLTIECLAMGKCVATFINPGFKTPHGMEIPVWNVNIDNLEEQLELLLSSSELRERLSHNGRCYVEKNNDVTHVCSELLKLYTSEDPSSTTCFSG